MLFAPNPGLTHTSLILVPPTIYNETHPEWYAAPEFGWPHGNQLCWKAPGLQEFLAQRVATLLRAQPNVSIISVSQSDDKVVKNSSSPVGYTIHSGECRTGQDLIETVKEGSPMAPMLQTVNFIADAIAKEFPHVAVNTLAYSYARLAPNITRPRSNVIVQLATGECNFGAAMTDISNAPFRVYMESWAKRSNRTWIWNYQTNFHSFITPFSDYFVLGSHIRYFVENNVTGIFQQGASSGPGSDMAELRDYVTARMMFEPTLDSTQLIVRFVAGYYGPAAAPHVMTYLHTIDAAVTNTSCDLKLGFDGIHAAFLTPEVLLRAAAVWAAARQAAASNPFFSAHVKRSALAVWYVVVHRWAELAQYAKAHRIAWPLEATLEGAFATLVNAVELTNAAYREGAPCVIEGPPWSNSCGQVMADAFSPPLNITALHDELFPGRRPATAIRKDLVGGNDKAGGHREAPHLRIFSFYGDDPVGQQGIVNVRLNNEDFPGNVGHFNFSSIDASFAKNMSSFIDIGGYNNMVWKGHSGVLPGWQDRVTSTLIAASSRIASGAVVGLFLGDEIVCSGMPVENLTAVAAFCKKKLTQMGYTQALVYLNECSGSFLENSPNRRPNDYFKDSIPAGLDIISYDSYQLSNNTKFAPTPWWLQEPIGNRLFYKTHILPKLGPHQKFMVVPGFYGNDSATADEQTLQDGRLLAKLEQYWTWMKEDPKVVGIVPYLLRRIPLLCLFSMQ